MLLITGTQRSGTRYTALVLARAGLNATHEGNDPERGEWREHDPRQGPRTDVDVDVCWHSAWWLGTSALAHATVVHLVREPLASISSSVARKTFWRPYPSGKWAIKKIPSLGEGSNIWRCAQYWVEWNRLIEPHAHIRIQVESLSRPVLGAILEFGGVDFDTDALTRAVATTSTATNANVGRGSRTRPRNVSWEDIDEPLRHKARMMAREYGYD